MLEVKNLTAIRDERILFESLSFEIHAGELVQIEGRNGTGKTTLLRIIAGLGECECGEILWQRSKIQSDRESYHQDLLFLGHQTGHLSENSPHWKIYVFIWRFINKRWMTPRFLKR